MKSMTKSSLFVDYLRLFDTARHSDAHVVALTMLFTLPIFVVYAMLHLVTIAAYLVIGAIASFIGLGLCVALPFAYLFDWVRFKLRKNG